MPHPAAIARLAQDPRTSARALHDITIFHRDNIRALTLMASREDLQESHIIDLMTMEDPQVSRAILANPHIDEQYKDYARRFAR